MTTPPSLPTRTLSDLTVSALGLGCMGMSFAYGPADQDEAVATLHRSIDLGVTFLDTADVYGGGANEELLAPVLRTRRDEVVLATKFGIQLGASGMPNGQVNGRPEYAHAACDASLKRLGVDRVDLYYLHRPDPDVPIEDTVGAMGELVTAGKVAHLGLSEASAATVRRAAAVATITAVQSEWSVFSRDIETTVLPACRELGIGLVPYSPLGRGMLTGALADLGAGDFRTTLPRFRARRWRPIWRSWTRSGRSPPATAPRPGRWHWRGCSPRATTWSRSPARSAGATWTRTWAPSP